MTSPCWISVLHPFPSSTYILASPFSLPLSGFRKHSRFSNTPASHTKIMTGKDILTIIKEKAGSVVGSLVHATDTTAGKLGKSGMSRNVTHGFHLIKGKSHHPMEDYLVSQFKRVHENDLGLFAIFDGHMGHKVANYLSSHLFDNILKDQNGFWTDTKCALKRAYAETDSDILEQSASLGRGGSTAVTAILVNCQKLVVANVGDSRAVLSKNGVAKQLSVDHEPSLKKERKMIESKGGFVSNIPGDVPRVDGQLAVARAFGDKSLKRHLSSEPDVYEETIGEDAECLILASDGLWKVMTNQEAIDAIKNIKDPQHAAKHLTEEAIARKSRDDISCIVVKFH